MMPAPPAAGDNTRTEADIVIPVAESIAEVWVNTQDGLDWNKRRVETCVGSPARSPESAARTELFPKPSPMSCSLHSPPPLTYASGAMGLCT